MAVLRNLQQQIDNHLAMSKDKNKGKKEKDNYTINNYNELDVIKYNNKTGFIPDDEYKKKLESKEYIKKYNTVIIKEDGDEHIITHLDKDGKVIINFKTGGIEFIK